MIIKDTVPEELQSNFKGNSLKDKENIKILKEYLATKVEDIKKILSYQFVEIDGKLTIEITYFDEN